MEKLLFILQAKKQNKNIIKLLLKNGSDMKKKDNEGNNPVHIACQNGNDEIIINEFLNKNKYDNIRRNVNKFFSKKVHIYYVREVINEQNNKGLSLLHMACQNGSKEMVKFLLNNEADIKSKTNDDEIPLHFACEKGNKEIVSELLNYFNENPNGLKEYIHCKTKDDETSLHIACKYGNHEVVSELLEKASIVNFDDYINLFIINNKKTPLHIACEEGHKNVVEILLKNKNINVNARCDGEKTALYIACEKGYSDIVKLIINEKINNINDLKKNIASDGMTPLHIACKVSKKNNPKEIIKRLIKKFKEDNNITTVINLEDNKGWSAIYYAICYNNNEIVKYLIKKGADYQRKVNINIQDILSTKQQIENENNYLKDVEINIKKMLSESNYISLEANNISLLKNQNLKDFAVLIQKVIIDNLLNKGKIKDKNDKNIEGEKYVKQNGYDNIIEELIKNSDIRNIVDNTEIVINIKKFKLLLTLTKIKKVLIEILKDYKEIENYIKKNEKEKHKENVNKKGKKIVKQLIKK